MKHALKGWLREAWARGLVHLGLWRLVDRLMPRRMLVLAGHCVAEEASNGGLPEDMKVEAARLGLVVLKRIIFVLDARECGAGHGIQEVADGARRVSPRALEALRHVGHGPSEQRAQALERLHGAAPQDAAQASGEAGRSKLPRKRGAPKSVRPTTAQAPAKEKAITLKSAMFLEPLETAAKISKSLQHINFMEK